MVHVLLCGRMKVGLETEDCYAPFRWTPRPLTLKDYDAFVQYHECLPNAIVHNWAGRVARAAAYEELFQDPLTWPADHA
jgi:hypothetical protein